MAFKRSAVRFRYAPRKKLGESRAFFVKYFTIFIDMKKKKGQKRMRITEADYMLAQRRAARLEEIAEHGKPISLRKALHKSKKVYDRKRLKKQVPED